MDSLARHPSWACPSRSLIPTVSRRIAGLNSRRPWWLPAGICRRASRVGSWQAQTPGSSLCGSLHTHRWIFLCCLHGMQPRPRSPSGCERRSRIGAGLAPILLAEFPIFLGDGPLAPAGSQRLTRHRAGDSIIEIRYRPRHRPADPPGPEKSELTLATAMRQNNQAR